MINSMGLARKVEDADLLGNLGAEQVIIPDDEVEVIKEVPAVVTHPDTNEKVTVGTAFIHSDRSVAIKYDEDAPEWALDLIKATAQEVGYSLEAGAPINGSP